MIISNRFIGLAISFGCSLLVASIGALASSGQLFLLCALSVAGAHGKFQKRVRKSWPLRFYLPSTHVSIFYGVGCTSTNTDLIGL